MVRAQCSKFVEIQSELQFHGSWSHHCELSHLTHQPDEVIFETCTPTPGAREADRSARWFYCAHIYFGAHVHSRA